MTDLQTLLDRSVDHLVDDEVDVDADLRRGHRALRRRRTRVAAGLTGGLAVLGCAGVPTFQHLTGPASQQPAVETGRPLVHTRSFEVPRPPEGWHIDMVQSTFLTMTRPDNPNTNLWLFEGKIVVQLNQDHDWYGFGRTIQYDGRTFYDNERNTDPILAVRLTDGRWLQLQYPASAGFTTQQMIEFLDRVVVLTPPPEPAD